MSKKKFQQKQEPMPEEDHPFHLLQEQSARKHHQNTLSLLFEKWNASNSIPPVLLLTGSSGIGKNRAGCLIAQWILCENRNQANPCDECVSCQKFRSHHHTNFTQIPLDEDHLKIETFRKIKTQTSLHIHESSYQVVLLPNAERLTHQAANSVLKLLEEPPPGWIFILTTDDQSLLPVTLISRCQQVLLKPFSETEVRAFLSHTDFDQEKQIICSKLARGSLDRALLYGDEEVWDQRKGLFKFLSSPAKELPFFLDWGNKHEKHLDLICDLLEGHLAELIHWSVSSLAPEAFSWANQDHLSLIAEHIQKVSDHFKTLPLTRLFWMEQMEILSDVRRKQGAPVNRKILLQGLLLPWLMMG